MMLLHFTSTDSFQAKFLTLFIQLAFRFLPPDCCYKEQTGEKNIKGVITWNSILADSFDRQTCPYGFYDYDFNTTVFYKASRFCQPNFQDGAQWQAPNMSDCAYRTLTTFKLEKMSEVSTLIFETSFHAFIFIFIHIS